MTELRRRVERLEHLATNAASVSATAEDLANFPGNKNLVAGANITLTPGPGTITIAGTGGGGGSGTVTSVSGSGGSTGLTLTGGPITTSGTLTLGGTLAIASGGTSATTAPAALTALGAYPATNPNGYTSNTGTVTSVGMSVPAFLSVAGSPVTTTGTLAVTYSGTALPIANGGTAGTTAAAARTNLGITDYGFTVGFDGGGSILTVGSLTAGAATLDVAGTVTTINITATPGTTPTVSIGIYKSTYAAYPTGTLIHTATLTGSAKNQTTGLTIACAAGDQIWGEVISNTDSVGCTVSATGDRA